MPNAHPSKAPPVVQPQKIFLPSITPSTVKNSHVVFTGRVISTSPWNSSAGSFAFTVSPCEGHPGWGAGPQAHRVVVVQGRAGREASLWINVGDEPILLGRWGACEEIQSKRGSNLQKKQFKIVYRKQIDGFLFNKTSGDFDWFTFPHSVSNGHAQLPIPALPDFSPPSQSDSSPPDARAPSPPHAMDHQPQSTASTQPTSSRTEPEPASSPVEQRPQKRAVPGPGEGNRSRKQQKREQKLGWGLTTTKAGKPFNFLSLDKVPTLIGGNQATIALAQVFTSLGRASGGAQDWTLTLNLYDPTLADVAAPVKANLFALKEDKLPPVEDGDVIIFLKVNIAKRPAGHCVVGYKGFTWALFKSSKPDKPMLVHPSLADQIGPEEIAYAKRLFSWWSRVPFAPKSASMSAGATPARSAQEISRDLAEKRKADVELGLKSARKLVTIAEMSEGTFCDTVAMVLKYIPARGFEDRGDLYISDWTVNEQLYDYDEASRAAARDKNVRWPLGQRTLQVSVYGHECEPLNAAEQNGVGRLVHIRNLGPRANAHGLLEARVSDKVQRIDERRLIQFVADDHFRSQREAILARMKEINKSNERSVDNSAPAAPQPIVTVHTSSTPQSRPQLVTQPQPRPQPIQTPTPAKPRIVQPAPPSPPSPVKFEPISPEQPRARPTPTPHVFLPEPVEGPDDEAEAVQAELERVEPERAEELLECRFKLQARIVDFAPAKLDDWIVARCPDCGDILSDNEIACMDHNMVEHSFRFFFALKSPQQTTPIVVSIIGDQANAFLPGLEPTLGMRQGGTELDKLRRRLGSLLGELESAKRRPAAPVPEKAWGQEAMFGLARGVDRSGRVGYWFDGTAVKAP